MGTRHLVKVIDTLGELRVAQYGQWDGYPSGQGVNILNFISGYGVIERLKPCLDKCHFVSQEVVNTLVAPYGEQWDSFYPQFSRDTCSDILKVVLYSSGRVPLFDNSEFENDDLFCEAVYTLNFQTNEFISQYGGWTVTVPLSLDELPYEEQYLKMFEEQRAESELA